MNRFLVLMLAPRAALARTWTLALSRKYDSGAVWADLNDPPSRSSENWGYMHVAKCNHARPRCRAGRQYSRCVRAAINRAVFSERSLERRRGRDHRGAWA